MRLSEKIMSPIITKTIRESLNVNWGLRAGTLSTRLRDLQSPFYNDAKPERTGDTMSAHTKGPWTTRKRIGGEIVIIPTDHERMPDSWIIAECRYQANDEANAAFIIRACNSHEAMLDALKQAVYHGNAKWLNPQALDAALCAIAKAEGRA